MTQTPAQKALYVLKNNLNIYDMVELIELLSSEVERQSQDLMKPPKEATNER